MKRRYTFLLTVLLLAFAVGMQAQNSIRVYKSDKTHVTFLKREIKNIKFDANKGTQTINLHNEDKDPVVFNMEDVDSVRSYNILFLYNVKRPGTEAESLFDKWYDFGWEPGETRVYFDLQRDGTVVYNGWTEEDENTGEEKHKTIKGTFTYDDDYIHLYFFGTELWRIKVSMITDDFFVGVWYERDDDDDKVHFSRVMEWGLVREIKGDWKIDYSQLENKMWGYYASNEENGAANEVSNAMKFSSDGKLLAYINGRQVSTGSWSVDKTHNILKTTIADPDTGEKETVRYQICNLTDRSFILLEKVNADDGDPDGDDYIELRIIK